MMLVMLLYKLEKYAWPRFSSLSGVIVFISHIVSYKTYCCSEDQKQTVPFIGVFGGVWGTGVKRRRKKRRSRRREGD
jgi:hypothetical protein